MFDVLLCIFQFNLEMDLIRYLKFNLSILYLLLDFCILHKNYSLTIHFDFDCQIKRLKRFLKPNGVNSSYKINLKKKIFGNKFLECSLCFQTKIWTLINFFYTPKLFVHI